MRILLVLSEAGRFSTDMPDSWQCLTKNGKYRRTVIDRSMWKLTVRSRLAQKASLFDTSKKSSSRQTRHLPSSDEDHRTRSPRSDKSLRGDPLSSTTDSVRRKASEMPG